MATSAARSNPFTGPTARGVQRVQKRSPEMFCRSQQKNAMGQIYEDYLVYDMESQKQNDVEKRLSKSRKITRNTLHHITHTAYGTDSVDLCVSSGSC